MPGVNVTTSARSGPVAPMRAASGQAFFVGQTERGPSDVAVRLRSFADYTSVFGERVSYGFLHDTVKTFFEEGGEQCYIARVVGPAATLGTVSVNDRAVVPVPTLKFDAANGGAWSSGLSIVISDGSLANTFRVAVVIGGNTVDEVNNLASPAEAVSKFSTSNYIRVTNLGSVSAAPLNIPVAGTLNVTAGADDRGNILTSHYTTAMELFTQGMGDGAVAVPGLGSVIHTSLTEHCKVNRRIALLSLDQTSTDVELKLAAAAVNSEYAGLFGPWVYVSDGAGGQRACSPEGFVAACRARAHSQVGPWRSPAGQIAVARSILGVVNEWQRTVTDSLDSGRVSVIRRVAGTIRLYGWRSLSQDETNYWFLSHRDLLNRLVVQSETELEQYVFTPIDGKGQVLSSINAQLVGILAPVANAGGLFPKYSEETGEFIDPGYSVVTDSSINSVQSLSHNQINATMLVRVAPTGALINLTIVKVGLLSGV